MDQGDGGDLFVELVFGVGDAEVAPDLGGVGVEGEDVFGELGEDGGQPGFELVGLGGVAGVECTKFPIANVYSLCL